MKTAPVRLTISTAEIARREQARSDRHWRLRASGKRARTYRGRVIWVIHSKVSDYDGPD